MRYIIIGGVAGGASTAARLRRLDEKADILLFERGEYISYANCGLPYYIGDIITDRSRLFVQTPQSFFARFHIDVRVKSEVEKIDAVRKIVSVKNLNTGETYVENYDKLVLSPGATPVRPPLEGIDSKGIFTLRNVSDTDMIKSYAEKQGVKRAVIVGAGFIGLEMAESLHHRGMEVSVIEMADQVMTPVDFEIASVVHRHFKTKQIGLFLNEAVTSFKETGNGLQVALKSGKIIPADLVILSIGVRPDAKLAKDAGLAIGTTGGIVVNEYLQTSDPDIYAVGDAIEFTNPISGRPSLSFMAGPANKQGRICANNIVGGSKSKYSGSIGTGIAKIFDLTVGTSGLSAKMLDRLNIPYLETIVHGNSHAGYYPGALSLTLKINFSPEDGRLLGAQGVGYEGVDKRIEMFASVLKNRGTIYDLMGLEHAYAPPYSSAKDPVNITGFVADNILGGQVKTINWREIQALDKNTVTLLSVCTPEECAIGKIEGSVNIPLDGLREQMHTLPAGKPIVVYCAAGLRGYVAARILMQHGFEVRNLTGGYKTYELAVDNHSNDPAEIKRVTSAIAVEPEIQIVGEPIQQITVDACGLQCPGPVMQLKKNMEQLANGGQLTIKATDGGFVRDVESWANMTGNRLLSLEQEKGIITAVLERGTCSVTLGTGNVSTDRATGKTIVVFSDDLDKALASFVIANGAASTGRKVTMFFTFWGLSVIKKAHPGTVEKETTGKMFGMMLPAGSKKLALSKMNMFGIGTRMMRGIMKNKKIDSLESLIQQAQENGIEFIACQMSMDVMGVKKEELLDGVTIGGVATYLERAEEANVNLFI